jgi:hypothetical protein
VIDYLAIAEKALVEMESRANPAQPGTSDPSDLAWAELRANASSALAHEGVRFLNLDGTEITGVWTDRDGPEIRAALRILGKDEQPIRYLDGDNVPNEYKGRHVEGEPVPQAVLCAMEAEPEAPWIVRDRMLAEMHWSPKGISWSEWKAALPVDSERSCTVTQVCEPRAPETNAAQAQPADQTDRWLWPEWNAATFPDVDASVRTTLTPLRTNNEASQAHKGIQPQSVALSKSDLDQNCQELAK